MYMLKADNLVKSFYKTEAKGKRVEFNAVDGISIMVEMGEILGILGPNGAGKTTLLRMLSGLMEPTSGEVCVTGKDGEVVKDTLEVKKSIGYLSGNTKLYGRMSVRELLKIFGTMYEIDEKVLDERIEKITEVLGMEEFVDNRIERLSTGQTQRASIARTIIHDPEIYIFDEPTLGLDIISSSAIIEFMKKEKERGKTVDEKRFLALQQIDGGDDTVPDILHDILNGRSCDATLSHISCKNTKKSKA